MKPSRFQFCFRCEPKETFFDEMICGKSRSMAEIKMQQRNTLINAIHFDKTTFVVLKRLLHSPELI